MPQEECNPENESLWCQVDTGGDPSPAYPGREMQVYDLTVSQAYGYLSTLVREVLSSHNGTLGILPLCVDELLLQAEENAQQTGSFATFVGDTNALPDDEFIRYLTWLASQENHDGEPWDALMDAADRLRIVTDMAARASRQGRRAALATGNLIQPN